MATREGDVEVIREGLTFKRFFTQEGTHPFDQVDWETRDAVIPNYKEGGNAFEQRDVEFPARGHRTRRTSSRRSTSAAPSGRRSASPRFGSSWRAWSTPSPAGDGRTRTSRPSDDAEIFADELTHLLVNQMARLQLSRVVQRRRRRHAAAVQRVLHPRGGRPHVLDPQLVRGRGDHLQGRIGLRHQPVEAAVVEGAASPAAGRPPARSASCAGADASAGTIKSGGKTRRAAKMVILDVDHPDVRDFIWCKATEEKKARALRDAGFDMDLDGRDSYSIQYQNANNSVRVTDEFMQAVLEDRDWKLKAVTTGESLETTRARDLMRDIALRGVGVRRPRHAVRHHDQRVAHLPGQRPDQRLQPVQRVHAPGQQRLQPGQPEPDEVPRRRRQLRRPQLPARDRDRVHGPGDRGRRVRLPDRRRSARTPGPSGSSGSATRTSARC